MITDYIYIFIYLSINFYCYIYIYTKVFTFRKRKQTLGTTNNWYCIGCQSRVWFCCCFVLSSRPPQTMGTTLDISIARPKCLCVPGKVVLWSKHFDIRVLVPIFYLKVCDKTSEIHNARNNTKWNKYANGIMVSIWFGYFHWRGDID